jgi:hypothetical protein
MYHCDILRPLYSSVSRSVRRLAQVFLLFFVTLVACSDNDVIHDDVAINPLADFVGARDSDLSEAGFSILPKYDYIRSYPGGGGIFVVRLISNGNFAGDVNLTLTADPLLNAGLSRRTLNDRYEIAEITVRPDQSIEARTYEIELRALYTGDPSHIGPFRKVSLKVEVLQWGPTNPANVISKRDEFIVWLETEHPELGNFSNRIWFPYMTYPQILIVEHWTFLDEDWEFRLCYHVMIPPYDWSKILLRRRGEWDPVLAAMRESDGTIHEIPISEYPVMFGY